jgi:CRP-like cAMP-binding protein
MLTPVERVLILKAADLLREVGPRHLLGLAEVAREFELSAGNTIYKEDDAADALYMVVEGRVRLSTGERTTSEVGPGEAFGTWALVDDSERGQRAECIEDGLALALHRDEFYDVAAGDLTLLQEVVRALARRLRALASKHPEEARVEGEGIEKPEAMVEAEATAAAQEPEAEVASAPSLGGDLAAAALGQTSPRVAPASSPELAPTRAEDTTPEPTPAPPDRTT